MQVQFRGGWTKVECKMIEPDDRRRSACVTLALRSKPDCASATITLDSITIFTLRAMIHVSKTYARRSQCHGLALD